MTKTKLFKVTLKPEYNRNLSERVEYVKCKDMKTLKESMISACASPQSEYYGYRKVEIEYTKDVPEIIQIKTKVTRDTL